MASYTGTNSDDLFDFNGLDGGDSIDGLLGQDTLDGLGNVNNYLYDIENEVISLTNGSLAGTLVNFEEILSGGGNDIIYGGTGSQPYRLDGGLGDDTIGVGSAGIIAGERYIGGAGVNVLDLTRGDLSYIVDMNTDELAQVGGGRTVATIDGFSRIDAGSGDDFIREQSGVQSTLNAGLGDDTLATASSGVGGGEVFNGGLGNDRFDFSNQLTSYTVNLETDVFSLLNGAFATTLLSIEDVIAGSGNDLLIGDGSSETFRGGAGNDRIEANAGSDVVAGNDGNDFILSGSARDTVFGGNGDDTIAGGTGDDSIRGDDNDDLIYGNDGDDTLDGGEGDDDLSGGDDNDLIFGRAGDDTIRGVNDNDRIFGGTDDDLIAGNEGNDTLEGGSDNDSIFGGTGNDVIVGGMGVDALAGGADADIFVFKNVAESPSITAQDTISDFVHNTDRIDLSGIANNLEFIGGSAFTGSAGEVRYNSFVGRLYIDIDGDGGLDFSLGLLGEPTVDAGDLIL